MLFSRNNQKEQKSIARLSNKALDVKKLENVKGGNISDTVIFP